MGIAAAILAGFVVAIAAPQIVRVAPRATGWILALLPAAIFVYFFRLGGTLPAEGLRFSFSWAPSLGLAFSLLLDGLSLLFALLISGMGALVLVYSQGYLKGKQDQGRFYAWMLTFMASMLGLVLADNVLTLYVFWELTSLSSFLLIGFQHGRKEARAGAWQALLVTSAGGLALLAGLLLLGQAGRAAGLTAENCFELSSLMGLGNAVQQNPLYLPILILVLCGAFTKSAQFPFHFWLPNAMEAPTPVSAYLHSATMVKAGIYLLARLSPILGGTDAWLWSVAGFGAATTLIGATLAILDDDLKRILAYSTVSALGMLMLLIGLDSHTAAAALVTFLLAHALYKGALFLVAGVLDHETGTRDITQLGGLARNMPFTATSALVAALSMAAIPPLFGFLGKEQMYEATMDGPVALLFTSAAVIGSMLFVAVAIMTGIRPFMGERVNHAKEVHEASASLWLGPALLGTLSLLFGLFPSLVDQPLLTRARAAIFPSENLPALSLELWHDWNATLALSGLTLLGGLCAYFFLQPARKALLPVSQYGPADLYERLLEWMMAAAKLQTRILQTGNLRDYVRTILLAMVGFAGYAFIRHGVLPVPNWSSIEWIDLGFVALIPAAILAILRARSALAAIVVLGVVGYGVALIFAFHGAPDLAMSQFLIETLTVILFVLVFYHLPPETVESRLSTRIRNATIAVAFGGMMTTMLLLAIHAGEDSSIREFFVSNSVSAAHGHNVVNVILVDFRALDTLGEITVLSAAGIGVYALLKLKRGTRADQ